MKANKNNISIETAKLLKDCKIPSGIDFVRYDAPKWMTKDHIDYKEFIQSRAVHFSYKEKEFYPAYTWQEILWEHPKEFLLNPNSSSGYDYWNFCDSEELDEFDKAKKILRYLQKFEYDKADKYFRENCVLIKK